MPTQEKQTQNPAGSPKIRDTTPVAPKTAATPDVMGHLNTRKRGARSTPKRQRPKS